MDRPCISTGHERRQPAIACPGKQPLTRFTRTSRCLVIPEMDRGPQGVIQDLLERIAHGDRIRGQSL